MLEDKIISRLKRIIGNEGVLTAKEDLNAYSYDATSIWTHMPEVVVLPTTTEQVSEVLKLANEKRIPVTPRGAGTSLSGGPVPIKGGIVLCSTRMNRLLEINKGNLTATVEAGLVLQEFNVALDKEGLFYPPDPQSFLGCTLGGTVAENAGGPYCVKYGVTKQYILGLKVVLASGHVVEVGGRTLKNRTGYELATLFAGSEGTLGVITEITLRLLPMPPANRTIAVIFDDMTVAGAAIAKIFSSGVIPAKLEFVDNFLIRRIEETTPMGLPTDAKALLLVQTDGSPATVEADTRQIASILKKNGAREVRVAKDATEADKYWNSRKAAQAVIYSATPSVMVEDITVPRDKLANLIQKIEDIAEKYDLTIPIVGHIGDGNLHPNILTDINDKENFARANKAMDEIFYAALALGGVISGEHGIGLEKKHFLKHALDPVAIEIMKGIKKILDPNNILNPGKIWEEDSSTQDANEDQSRI